METVDVLVIGAGVSGLAAVSAVAARGLTAAVLDRHPRPGLDASTHNSGVIHAGLYYPPGSLKARLCVEGRERLYAFCRVHGVPHARCGKFIVAADTDEIASLETLQARGIANGVKGLEIVDRQAVARAEPHVHAIGALRSRESGIVDQDALIKSLLRAATSSGAIFLPGTRVIGADESHGVMIVRTERENIRARHVVNAAGLYADDVSRMLGGEIFTIYPCRGEYAELVPSRRSWINGLVYPVPHGHGLGIHLVRGFDGAVRLGPTIAFQDRKDDYERDRLPVESFVEPAQRLLPGLGAADLRLSGAGIRAKLHPPTEIFADFLIRRDLVNPLVVQAAGIESPGLTSCLAVGALIARIVAGDER